MLQGDRVLVAHGLQMRARDTADGFHFGFGTEGAQSCTSSGSTTSSCGMCGMTKERRLRLPRSPPCRANRAAVGSRFRRPAYSRR